MGHAVCRRKGKGNVAAAVAEEGADPAQGRRGPPRRPPELPLVQRQVCGEDYNDGTLLRLPAAALAQPLGDLAAHMATADDEVARHAEVAHDQRADGILLAVHRDKARSGADAALEVHTYHAGAAADGALCKDAVCAADGAMHIVLGEMAAADVVQLAVIAFHYHAVDCTGGNADLRIFVYGAVDQCIQRRAD